jgi:predicted glycogen debranching enzyme
MPDRAALRTDMEWLEADGLGGFASGTALLARTRRYHALLLAAATPPTGRVALVNGVEAWIETAGGSFALSSQRYAPGVTQPDGTDRIERFTTEPWPTWTFSLPGGLRITHQVLVPHGAPAVLLSWKLSGKTPRAVLRVRPLLGCRDAHALHHENPAFRFDADLSAPGRVAWRPYDGVPAVAARSNGDYEQDPQWYRNFLYEAERERGLDHLEDLASPGEFCFDLARGEAALIFTAEGVEGRPAAAPDDAVSALRKGRAAEKRRRGRDPSSLARAARAYRVRRGRGETIVAGYPWFTDWGRDTFIALRGLCLATGAVKEAGAILSEWARSVSEGMLPNRFVEAGAEPEYNSVDASLWFVVAASEFLSAAAARGVRVTARERSRLLEASTAILEGYARGTRFGIRMDADGLLAAGQPGVQLTWMDAKMGDWVVTPRIGKPVEVQALWLNALSIGQEREARWREPFARAWRSFQDRFWNEAGGCLYDVVDADHREGAVDDSFRPNQIFAVGGLPVAVLEGERARRVVDAVESRLWTPLGLRTLAPGSPGYHPRYEGDLRARDSAYHQGTVWPWLIGPFVEAWVRVRGGTRDVKEEASRRFLAPVLAHLGEAGLDHVSEIADGDAPHTPRGCPFQAWSVGEALRLMHAVLPAGEEDRPAGVPTAILEGSARR